MKVAAACLAFLGCVWSAGAAPVTLISVLSDRPVFAYVSGGLTQNRALAPGNKIALDAGTFSGLGVKKAPLTPGSVYYLAQFGASRGLFVLGAQQVLLLNQSGRVVSLGLAGQTVTGPLFSGNFALGTADDGGLLAAWDDGSGKDQSQTLQGGHVYRFLLESPGEGLGLTVALKPWD